MKNVLFVCTGNTCRSPMAAAMFRKMAAESGLAAEVRSAGVAAVSGAPASAHAIRVLGEKEIDHSGHRSCPVTAELVEWADIIFTMTGSHRRMLVRSFPEAADKTHTLKGYARGDGDRVAQLDRLAAELETKRAMMRNAGNEGDARRREALEEETARLEEQLRALWSRADPAAEEDIADPFGGDEEEYRRCAAEMEEILRLIAGRWRKGRDGQ